MEGRKDSSLIDEITSSPMLLAKEETCLYLQFISLQIISPTFLAID